MIQGLSALETITLFVEDVAGARRFYETVFGRAVVYEDAVSTVFQFDNLMVNLLQSSEAGEVVGPRPVGGRDAGPRMLLTIRVTNVDAVCEELRVNGVELLNGPVDRPWGRRTAAFSDPAGNVWEVAQEL